MRCSITERTITQTIDCVHSLSKTAPKLQQPSIKKNFVYKVILTISTYITGFITFPYVSRVLGVERIGLVHFVDNTVSYFLLFATMGINVIGVREIAAVKHSESERSRVFSNILSLNILFTIAALAIYIVTIWSIPKLNQYSELFYIGAAKIIFTAFLIEWFFSGIENFKYITLRSLIIKTIYIIAIFTFVDNADDYKLYFIFTVGVVVVNAIINLLYVRKYIRFRTKAIRIGRLWNENIVLGFYTIMTSMYITFNVMYLGLTSDNVQVGYYTTAFKLYTIIIGVFSAFTSVMLPRMTAIIAGNDMKQFYRYTGESLKIIITFSVPLIICSIIMAPQIIYVLSGIGYEGAVIPMRIIMPAAFAVGIAQVLSLQILIPLKKDNILLIASAIGAVSALILNLIAVTRLSSIGSAIVLIFSEYAVALTYIIYVSRKHIIDLPIVEYTCKAAIRAIPSIAACIICCMYISNHFVSLASAVATAVLLWIMVNRNLVRKFFCRC